MMFPFFSQRVRAIGLLVAPAVGLGACGTASPLPPVSSGPSWSLSKGQNDLSAPRGGTVPTGRYEQPNTAQPQYAYKGGRDPNSGRALATVRPAAPLAHPPGVLPPDPRQRPTPAQPGVRATTTYQPGAPQTSDPGGPGIPYQAPRLETVRKGETLSVMPGDSLTGIASRHRVSVAELMRVNQLVTPVLQPGQRIVIPAR